MSVEARAVQSMVRQLVSLVSGARATTKGQASERSAPEGTGGPAAATGRRAAAP